MSVIGMDPPRHVKLRNLASKGFTPRRIAALESDIRAIAHRYMKRNLNLALHAHARDALDLEAEAMMRTGATEDFREAARAFLEKRTPRFRGRCSRLLRLV